MNKRPKLTHTKLPMMFYVPGQEGFSTRYRIIYPDGKCQWQNGQYIATYNNEDSEMLSPCWAEKNDFQVADANEGEQFGKCKSARKAIKLMKQYDKNLGYKSLFLGYIK